MSLALEKSFKQLREDLFQCQSYKDFKFLVANKSFEGHKLIFLQCSNFAEQIEKSNELEIKEVPIIIFEKIFEYLYTGRIEISEKNYIEYIKASELLGIKELSLSCYHFIFKTQCTEENVLKLLLDAKNGKFGKVNIEDLMNKCQSFIAENAEVVFQSKEFINLEEEMIISFLKLSKLSIDEFEIYKSLMKWCKNQKSKIPEKKEEEILKNMIPLIRLPLIEAQDLILTIKPTNLFPIEEYLDAIEYQLSPDDINIKGKIKYESRGQRYLWENKKKEISGTPTSYTMYFGTLLKSGKHKWSIKLEQYSGNDWNMIMGVCQTGHGKSTYLGDQMGWGWSSHGSKNHQSGAFTKTWDTYAQGDILTFELDLTKGTMNLWKNKSKQSSSWTGIVGPVHIALSASASFKAILI